MDTSLNINKPLLQRNAPVLFTSVAAWGKKSNDKRKELPSCNNFLSVNLLKGHSMLTREKINLTNTHIYSGSATIKYYENHFKSLKIYTSALSSNFPKISSYAGQQPSV